MRKIGSEFIGSANLIFFNSSSLLHLGKAKFIFSGSGLIYDLEVTIFMTLKTEEAAVKCKQ